MFDVRLIESFMAVAKHRHFGRAAEALNATQPGVSQHIAKLEAQLDVKLVARTRRSVELTTAGETFLEYAHRLLPLMQRMAEDTQAAARGSAGKLELGFSSSVIYSDIPARIAAFKAQTKVELKFRVQGGDELRDLLDWGELDAIITTLPLEGRPYLSTPIAIQRMGVAIHPSHPLADRATLRLDDICAEPFIVVPRSQHPLNHDTLIARFSELGWRLNGVAYETSFPNVLARVAVGEGVAIVALGHRGDESAAVRVIPLEDPLLSTTWIFAVARHDNLRPATRRLIEALPKPVTGPPSTKPTTSAVVSRGAA